MLFNYHTHTKLCGHARGENREYVENAIKRGLKTLGFSDHAPYYFPTEERRNQRRHAMHVDKIHEYADSVRALAKEYQKDIRILCGFELEYYPDYHEEEMAFLRTVSPDYLILGQHYTGNEWGKPVHATSDDALFSAYVTQAIAGLATGDFLYLAHPDMPGQNLTKEVATREYRRICEFAKKKNIPLEINFLGLGDNRCYPSKEFFAIAAEVGNEVLFGIDAHTPESLLAVEVEEKALQMVNELGLKLIEKDLL
ncbi:MAG: histidinol-phosphatase HisJ family protein [Clostridiales bacterium]|nr:histidinol-phosphatase HisJ family protein [Clostridiales bacterium]